MTEIITLKTSRHETIFRAGDYVYAEGGGDGIVVGFTSYTGEPSVYFYSRQEVVCIGSDQLKRI